MPRHHLRALDGVASLRVAVPAALTLMLACAPSTAASRSNSAAVPTATGSRVITREQLAALNVLDAYGAIERLGGYRLAENGRGQVSVRQRRGQASVTNPNSDRPLLVVDGTQLSDFEILRRIRVNEIERIELVSPGDATQRFGTGASGAGAIILVTRTR